MAIIWQLYACAIQAATRSEYSAAVMMGGASVSEAEAEAEASIMARKKSQLLFAFWFF